MNKIILRPLSEARNELARLITRARAGETVVLTKHGEPVAQITPEIDEATRRQIAESHLSAGSTAA